MRRIEGLGAAHPHVSVRNQEPRGRCCAANQALRVSTVVFLNFDTIVMTGRLQRLLD